MRVLQNKYMAFYLGTLVVLASCTKNLPSDRDELSVDADFTIRVYEPTLGRNDISGMSNNFSDDFSSLPMEFTLLNVRDYEGNPAQELLDIHPVLTWKSPYLGTEKSLEEIEEKRQIEYRPLFEIGKHNGSFRLWANASSNFVRTQPDSCYYFDVEVSNTGGRKFIRNLQLKPLKERPFEPSNQNLTTGQITNRYVNGYLNGFKGHDSGRDMSASDMHVYFNKIEGDLYGGKTLTFRFMDSLMRPIDPGLFAMTDEEWREVIHGFNMEKTDEYVRYEVAYPIPLAPYPTKYTNSTGTRSSARFKHERLGFGQILEESQLGVDFSIYEKGDWEIYFVFWDEMPRFGDE